jgi:diguanylate cyclase (GGDEF)-like protein
MKDISAVRNSGHGTGLLFNFLIDQLTPGILENFHQPLLILDSDLKVLWGNQCYYDLFQTTPLETEGIMLGRLGGGEWNIFRLTDCLKQISFGHSDINDWEVARQFDKIGQRTLLLHAHQISEDRNDSGRHILFAIEDITERKQKEEMLQALSFTDVLTKLYNRRGFLALTVKRLKSAQRTKTSSCFFFADVDGLKKINDTHGHAAGDSALVDIAGILKETFRVSDIVARLSGDEFVVLMSPALDGSEARVADRLKKNLAVLNSRGAALYKLSLSMGSYHFNSSDPSTIGELMEKADKKLYELKKNRKILFPEEEPKYLGDYSKDE